MKNPTIVTAAFVPDTPRELTLEAALVLEACGCQYLTGGTPGLRDAVLVWLALTDLPGLKRARAEGGLDLYVETWASDKRPGDLLALQTEIAAAVEAAFAPSAGGATATDPLEKKGVPPAAGG